MAKEGQDSKETKDIFLVFEGKGWGIMLAAAFAVYAYAAETFRFIPATDAGFGWLWPQTSPPCQVDAGNICWHLGWVQTSRRGLPRGEDRQTDLAFNSTQETSTPEPAEREEGGKASFQQIPGNERKYCC